MQRYDDWIVDDAAIPFPKCDIGCQSTRRRRRRQSSSSHLRMIRAATLCSVISLFCCCCCCWLLKVEGFLYHRNPLCRHIPCDTVRGKRRKTAPDLRPIPEKPKPQSQPIYFFRTTTPYLDVQVHGHEPEHKSNQQKNRLVREAILLLRYRKRRG